MSVLTWERRSKRLWVAEYDGRTFRIHRTEMGGDVGTAVLSEVDRLQHVIQQAMVNDFKAGKRLADEWI